MQIFGPVLADEEQELEDALVRDCGLFPPRVRKAVQKISLPTEGRRRTPRELPSYEGHAFTLEGRSGCAECRRCGLIWLFGWITVEDAATPSSIEEWVALPGAASFVRLPILPVCGSPA
jgi:hypothetical protein